ncbi:MAG TPA: hypothetical protein VN673_10630 [Clostridia bacterium]|nr:hypothetical protein [Clostridia bacterium]
MKRDQYEEGRFTEHAHGLGTVTEDMIRNRAREIAQINGRSQHQVLDSDLDQARRELTGEERLNPDPTSEEELENRPLGVQGRGDGRVPSVPAPDEQTFAEKLVEEGVQEAEHEQMVEATRESIKKEKRS